MGDFNNSSDLAEKSGATAEEGATISTLGDLNNSYNLAEESGASAEEEGATMSISVRGTGLRKKVS
jgi:hypothetical protein